VIEERKGKEKDPNLFLRGKEFWIFYSLKNPSRKRIPRLSLSHTATNIIISLLFLSSEEKQTQIETERKKTFSWNFFSVNCYNKKKSNKERKKG
jgi:hypothetical protein